MLATASISFADEKKQEQEKESQIEISSQSSNGGVTVNHNHTDINQVPESFISEAKENFNAFYIHTSHGSQIISGMEALENNLGSLYALSSSGGNGSLKIEEEYGDLGHNGDLGWEYQIRDRLGSTGNGANLVMVSWCGGASDNTSSGINVYLNAMNRLEEDYPGVTFVYMTGHLDGTGESGNLNQMNNLIRSYTSENNKVFFDFADIESYDPSGNYFLDQGATDECYYSGGNWANEWCNNNSTHLLCSYTECAHSQSLNCNLKGSAFWWMLARLSGWDGSSSSSSSNSSSLDTNSSSGASDLSGDSSSTSTGSVVEEERGLVSWVDNALSGRLSGRILLQVERNGETWYVYPDNQRKYYLGRPHDAFNIMRSLGLGITNLNLRKIAVE